jgi:type II secretory pathway pseudopilin PulG
MPPFSSRLSRKAMSLVEVLAAVTILSLALLVFVTVSQSSRALTDKGDATTRAAQSADDMINTLTSQGYSSLSSGTTTYTVSNLRNGLMNVVIGPLDGIKANKNIIEIDVTVTWGAYSSATPQSAGNITRSTLISDI